MTGERDAGGGERSGRVHGERDAGGGERSGRLQGERAQGEREREQGEREQGGPEQGGPEQGGPEQGGPEQGGPEQGVDGSGRGGRGPEVEEIGRRRELALGMGGPDKIRRQTAAGRLTVRERIARLADPGSFAEIGALTGFGQYDADGRLVAMTPANFVAGTATIGGIRVMLGADDFTVRGGSGTPPSTPSRCSPSSTRVTCGCPSCGCLTGRAAAAA